MSQATENLNGVDLRLISQGKILFKEISAHHAVALQHTTLIRLIVTCLKVLLAYTRCRVYARV